MTAPQEEIEHIRVALDKYVKILKRSKNVTEDPTSTAEMIDDVTEDVASAKRSLYTHLTRYIKQGNTQDKLPDDLRRSTAIVRAIIAIQANLHKERE